MSNWHKTSQHSMCMYVWFMCIFVYLIYAYVRVSCIYMCVWQKHNFLLLSIFALIYNQSPEFFTLQMQTKTALILKISHSSLHSSPGNHDSAFSLGIWLFWELQIRTIIQCLCFLWWACLSQNSHLFQDRVIFPCVDKPPPLMGFFDLATSKNLFRA